MDVSKVMANLVRDMWVWMVGTECVPGSGQGLGDVQFQTVATRVPSDRLFEGVSAVAKTVKETAERLEASRVHVLTYCTALPLSGEPDLIEVFCDVLFEKEDGTFVVPSFEGARDVTHPDNGPTTVWISDEAAPWEENEPYAKYLKVTIRP